MRQVVADVVISTGLQGREDLIDPDAIARRIDPAQLSQAAIPAAREAILRCKTLTDRRAIFSLETTLAGQNVMGVMRRAHTVGYRVVLVYVSLGSPELHIEGYFFASQREVMTFPIPIYGEGTFEVSFTHRRR